MAGKFKDQVILVTGAASGIGRATTIRLAALGASLALADVNTTGLSTLASELPDAPILTQKVDVSSEADVKSLIAAILAKFGKLDHVFNCAGINPTNIPFAETTLEYWDMLCSTNLKGVFLITRESLPHLKRGSSIVTVSSLSGTRGTPLQSVYRIVPMFSYRFLQTALAPAPQHHTTKHGVIGMMKSLAHEVGPQGIRANCVAPGYINTPTNSGIVRGGEVVEQLAKACSLERWGTPEDVADVVVFLLSDESRYVSGSVYEVDGAVRQ
ncbi:3-oxoacyl-(acyl-carrier-protein) reductase [Diaporthe helianthi]|uniref:3-oxoacyl-(Acyl-carrier-protein) reductase n=1 Tax=Diaporthe helianthi TaxID=158607 RepID=A0A2P5HG31_DIAHE|nr:3-oxoacyl-(acyl-carrier-protein) reductase [Diaporthe helianthi]